MNQLSGLFKTVLYRVIFNSLVGVVALLLIIFLFKGDSYFNHAHNNSLLHYYLTNTWIIILLITIAGEILCAFGETVTLLIFNFNSLVNDDNMEFTTPQFCNASNSAIASKITYGNFILMLNSDKTATEFSEINFVLGRVFAGLGVIGLITTFYFFDYILIYNQVVIEIMIVVALIGRFSCNYIVEDEKHQKKHKINSLILVIMITIIILIAYILKNSSHINIGNNILSYLLFLSFFATILFFYISILYISFANKLNKEIVKH